MKIYVLLFFVIFLTACDKLDDQNTDKLPITKESTIKFSKNQMIVQFDDSWEGNDKDTLRDNFSFISPPEKCKCGDPNIELWTIDTTATDTDIERARDRLNRNSGGGRVKGDIDFEITIPIDKQIAAGGDDNGSSTLGVDDDVVIAIIDTGIDYYYDSIDYEYLLDTEGLICDNSYTGWDFVDDSDNPIDKHGHGTYVTKIIRNILEPDGIGFKIIPLKVFNENGKGNYSDLVCAFGYLNKFEEAAGKNIDIVNASFGGTMTVAEFNGLTLLPDLIEKLGDDTVIVASAGNEGKEIDTGDIRHFPSGFDSPNILAVGGYGLDSSGAIEIHASSNRGTSSIDLATLYGPYNLEFNATSAPITITNLQGTSYGAAYVSGIAAKEKGNNMAIPNLRGHVLNLTEPISSLNSFVAEGRVIEQPPTP
ncbi:S8 family serine peptidase [Kriegella aquimaris]|uniref:Subtilase family protein n=1 Tax=Kriegella aquimaris TaxID=192904 RepID=A0A1G9UWB4_9FLAO|nr:S8 family serine peptidase [Kriegella aquimaris]SDM64232.1 Subtilase family protein [Kriegella aquimaris]